MALLNSPSSKSPIWTRDRVSSPSRSHFSPGLKLILRTQVTNPEHGRFQSLSKGVYGTTIFSRYDRRCSTNIPSLFFKCKLVETDCINSSINICMRQTKSGKTKPPTVSIVLNDDNMEMMIENDYAFKFLKTIRSTPAFWQQKQKELMSMMRQLGCPTFFLTLSAAETMWLELLKILKDILDGVKFSDDDIIDLQWSERADLIRRDPVTCARYFDHRSREFFKVLKTKVYPPWCIN